MRHAHPVNGPPMDGERPLTAKGKKQAATMADFLVREIGRVDIVITSPFVRAMQTAEIIADALGSHIADTRMLEPDGKPEEMWAEIERLAQVSEHVLVVGHMPSINALHSWLISGGSIRFEHGAISHIKTVKREDPPQVIGTLHYFVEPKLVEKDEQEEEVLEALRDLVALS